MGMSFADAIQQNPLGWPTFYGRQPNARRLADAKLNFIFRHSKFARIGGIRLLSCCAIFLRSPTRPLFVGTETPQGPRNQYHLHSNRAVRVCSGDRFIFRAPTSLA